MKFAVIVFSDKKERLGVMMKKNYEIKKSVIMLLLAAVLLPGGFSAKFCNAKTKEIALETRRGVTDAQEKKREREYAKWKVVNRGGAYYYHQKEVRFLIDDTGKHEGENQFYYNKKGKVDIRIIRNRRGRVKKIVRVSKKKAEKMQKNWNTGYVIRNMAKFS